MKFLPYLLPGLLLGVALPAAAGDVRIHGFGQVVAGQVLQNDRQPAYLPHDDQLSFAPESLFAVQISAPLSDQGEAVAQIVARGREDYEPDFSWAYLRYTINDRWHLKLGRQRAPYYMYSDYLDVGAAYPFLRTPSSVYRSEFSNLDGLNFTGNYVVGKWELQPQILYSSSGSETIQTTRGDTKLYGQHNQFIIAAISAQYDEWLRLRLAANQAKVSLDIMDPGYEGLLQALRSSGNDRAADLAEVKNDRLRSLTAGIELEHKGAFLGSEYVRYEVEDSFVGEGQGWYVAAGYRYGPWTPYATVGRFWGAPDGSASAAASPPFNTFVAQLEASTRVDIRELTLGIRYDLRHNVALKAEFTRQDSQKVNQPDVDIVAAGVVFTY